MIELNRIIYKDCMNEENGLPTLEDNSIDIVFFDPPYNANKNYGIYKDNLPEKEYLSLMQQITNQCLRISKRGIGVYVDSYRLEIWWKFIFRNAYPIIIWKRSPGFSNKQKIYSSYHAILTNIIANKNIPGLWHDLHPVSDGIYWRLTKDYVSDDHPAQTSYEIVARFIQSFSYEGDTILDPFMGTGTTAEACIKNNLKWLGFELNEPYSQYIEERLKNCKKEPQQIDLKNYII